MTKGYIHQEGIASLNILFLISSKICEAETYQTEGKSRPTHNCVWDLSILLSVIDKTTKLNVGEDKEEGINKLTLSKLM